MDELLEHFILEGRELVQDAARGLMALERDGYQPAQADSAFRAIHTLKGSAGLFDMAPLGAALHAAEDLMQAARTTRRRPDRQAMDALMDCIGTTESWIEWVATTGRLPDGAPERAGALVAALQAAGGAAPQAAVQTDGPAPDWLGHMLAEAPSTGAQTGLRYTPQAGCFFLGDDPLALVAAMPQLVALHVAPARPWDLASYDPFSCNLVIHALSAAPPDAVRAAFRLVADQMEVLPIPAAVTGRDEPAARPSLRVEAGRIDTLADLVSELLVARTRLAHLAAQAATLAPALAGDLAASAGAFDRLAGAMHSAVTQIRLIPLDQSFRRLPRVAREVAASLGRDLRFTVEGAAIQADKATVDGLFEPLMHVLRNAIDHGIEPPAARLAAGKPAQGNIALRAVLDAGQVVITLTDDGAGIDRDALRHRAVSHGLTAAELDAMDDTAVLDLVFLPGVSTAARVTHNSGRGVGMDAVRAALQAMGGQAGIAPAPGGGTQVRLAVPQSSAILTIVLVEAGGQSFGIPADMIAEVTTVRREAITPIGAGHACVLRGRTLPLLNLAARLGAPVRPGGAAARVVVATAGGQDVGLEVDGFGARMDVVLRPLPSLLAGTPFMRGAAQLGDGSVLLVLDPGALLQ